MNSSEEFLDSIEENFKQLLPLIEQGIKKCSEYYPTVEGLFLDLIDPIVSLRLVRQIAMIAAIQISLRIYNSVSDAVRGYFYLLSEKGKLENKLRNDLKNAKTYNEWRNIATQLDELHGKLKWMDEDESPLYDGKMIKKRNKDVLDMYKRGDIFDLMFRLRGGLARDQFGIQHEGLFSYAMSGTKKIVEKYHENVSMALNFICDSPIADEEIPTDAKLAFFNETRHSFGRTALLLSGGAYLGYYHMGVVKALFQEGLLPRVLSGASAGSIMTSLIGTRTDAELNELFSVKTPEDVPDSIRMDFFRFSEELNSEFARRLNYLVPQAFRWITSPIFSSIFDKKILNLDTDHFKKVMMNDVGLYTFQEAFDRTGRIINITVAPMNNYDPPRLLNYLTAPHVCVWSATAASCAIPGIFDSISLIVKEPNGQYRPENEWTRKGHGDTDEGMTAKLSGYSDGSLENDLPMQQLSELFNVNHFIVSQVNPHSAFFSALSMKANIWSHPMYKSLVGYLRFLTAQLRDWFRNIVDFVIILSKAPIWSARRGLTQTLTQDYEGRDNDVTIMPWAGHVSPIAGLLSAIKNPTKKEFLEVTSVAEANTWPSLTRIRAHCLIEMTLDKCVQRLRKRISDESDLRIALATAATKGGVIAAEARGKMDRLPSFYTSRSIVNLSGLSVSDPAPVTAVRRPSFGSTAGFKPRSRSNSYSNNKANILFNGTSNPMPSINDYVNNSTHHNNEVNSSPQQFVNQSHPDQDFFNLEVKAGEVPLDRTSSNQGLGFGLSFSYSEEDLLNHDEPAIIKTTHMANFYYKHDHSDEHLILEEN